MKPGKKLAKQQQAPHKVDEAGAENTKTGHIQLNRRVIRLADK